MDQADTATSSDLAIAVAATFTAQSLEPSLRFWMRELGIPARIEFAPYNQVFQELLGPTSLLSGNGNGANVVLIRLEDWLGAAGGARSGGDACPQIERNTRDFLDALCSAAKRSPASYLVGLCPASPQSMNVPGLAAAFERTEAQLAAGLTDIPGVYFLSPAELMDAYPVAEYYDEHAETLAHIPFTPLFFTALGTMISRKIYALKNSPYKVIALDCDETIWKGTCGEDGPLGVHIDSARKFLQEFMVKRHNAGMLLCLCSRNNEEDVAAVFECHPDMILRRDHFASWRTNWKSKSENLKSLAEELNLGLDSFIFIDDDPVQCAEVEFRCPEVLTLRLPQETEKIPKLLAHLWAFDRLKITAEDRARIFFYQQNAARESLRRNTLSFGDFIAGLRLDVQFFPLLPQHLARASDLTQRTNQFNFTTIRRSEAELQQICLPGATEALLVQVQDRFGDYGLVGLILFRTAGVALHLDTFLLSCRALGRGVEHRMLAKLGECALERRLAFVEMPFSPSGKNRPALEFLASLDAETPESANDALIYRVPSSVAARGRYVPPLADVTGEIPSKESGGAARPQPPADVLARAALLGSIAAELQDAEEIHRIVLAETRLHGKAAAPFVPAETPLEEKVAALWSEILGRPGVGRNDSFFALGGHSLLAVQVLSRMRQSFNVDLSPRLLYTTGFTVAELSQAIVAEQIRQASPTQDVDSIIRKLNELSDDEVRALLEGTKDDKQD